MGVLPKGVFIDLSAHNFMHVIASFRERCVHARHRARNLSSPGKLLEDMKWFYSM